MTAVGIDRSRGRWVWIAIDGDEVTGGVAASLSEIDLVRDSSTHVAIDIPLGVERSSQLGRRCEAEARVFVGARRSSVFSTLPLECYQAPYEERDDLVAALGLGRSYSKQAWNLRDAIFDAASVSHPRMWETHPEVAFRARSVGDLPPKKSWSGLRVRQQILSGLGVSIPPIPAFDRVPPDDVLDAAVCAVVACAMVAGEARHLPEHAVGGEPVIWY